jgi:O-6-methylguanine DNA methyltransferase
MDRRHKDGWGGSLDEAAMESLMEAAHRRVERALRRIRRPTAKVGVIASPLGPLLIAESALGVVSIRFLAMHGAAEALVVLRREFDLVEDTRSAERVGDEIRSLINGHPDALTRPVDLRMVKSQFQRKALERLRKVPPGSVITYQALAAAVGAPESQRAIGNTMASNPVPIYVPCHRVIRSDGSIGNYGGGVQCKVRLLRAEGFALDPGQNRLPEQAVFGHRETRIYCRSGCSAVRRAKQSSFLIFADAGQARQAGMRACRQCRPLQVT